MICRNIISQQRPFTTGDYNVKITSLSSILSSSCFFPSYKGIGTLLGTGMANGLVLYWRVIVYSDFIFPRPLKNLWNSVITLSFTFCLFIPSTHFINLSFSAAVLLRKVPNLVENILLHWPLSHWFQALLWIPFCKPTFPCKVKLKFFGCVWVWDLTS